MHRLVAGQQVLDIPKSAGGRAGPRGPGLTRPRVGTYATPFFWRGQHY